MKWALVYGVPYDLFWHLNPTKLKPWREAYEEKNRANDVTARNIGRYVLEAIASCFGDHTYTDMPYSIKEQQEEQKGFTDAERFEIWAMQFNSQRNNNNDKG